MQDLATGGGLAVWRTRVSAELPRLEQHRGRLSEAEQARAERFHQSADRQRFLVAHGVLRELLGRALGVAPAALVFGTAESGKPGLLPAQAALHFNLSHSGDWVLHAFCRSGPVGVDVEAVRPELARLDDFESVFSAPERAGLYALPPEQRAAAFARFWVRKEAYVKALGDGLSRSLPDICIGPDPHGRIALLYDRSPAPAPQRWVVADLEVDPVHAGCIVHIEGAGPLRIHDYQPAEVHGP